MWCTGATIIITIYQKLNSKNHFYEKKYIIKQKDCKRIHNPFICHYCWFIWLWLDLVWSPSFDGWWKYCVSVTIVIFNQILRIIYFLIFWWVIYFMVYFLMMWPFFKSTTKHAHFEDECLFINDNHATSEGKLQQNSFKMLNAQKLILGPNIAQIKPCVWFLWLWICSKTREIGARHSRDEGGPFEKNGDMEELGPALWGDGREGQLKNLRKI